MTVRSKEKTIKSIITVIEKPSLREKSISKDLLKEDIQNCVELAVHRAVASEKSKLDAIVEKHVSARKALDALFKLFADAKDQLIALNILRISLESAGSIDLCTHFGRVLQHSRQTASVPIEELARILMEDIEGIKRIEESNILFLFGRSLSSAPAIAQVISGIATLIGQADQWIAERLAFLETNRSGLTVSTVVLPLDSADHGMRSGALFSAVREHVNSFYRDIH